ncbi:NAD(P)-binding protein, partial [Paucibacter sp. XJ19-41]|uniref:NAD(P)-binding protein n=1 Tax=Paucibacter sp. XJ19-41 TaxID=2927824 RepID=UPI003FA6EC44
MPGMPGHDRRRCQPAGLHEPGHRRHGDSDDMMNRTLDADITVVGAGPAGIAAVCRLIAAGRRVVWVDQGARPGGQIWRAGL